MFVARVAELLEVLGGSRPLPAQIATRGWAPLGRGAWWLLLFLLGYAFAGRATKFIYVDF
jgi:hypothetical protein